MRNKPRLPTAAGQIRFAGGIVKASIDGDLAAEFEIELINGTITEDDFIL